MLFIATALCFAVLTPLGHSQSISSESAPSSTSGAAPSASKAVQVHTVAVGKAQNQFDPDIIEANVGDIIQFQFFPPNHSVARADWGTPCIPYEDTGRNRIGFWSGFFPVDTILSNPPTWNLTVNDTSPVFFYCAAPGSCQNWGMVGVINPNATATLDTQKTKAKGAPYMIVPGESFPSGEVASSLPTNTASATGSTAQATNSAAAVSSGSTHSNKLSSGAIAGIVIGAVVIAGLLGTLLYFFGRHRTMIQFLKRDQHVSHQQQPPEPGMTGAPHSPFSPHMSMPYSPRDPGFDYSPHEAPPYPKYHEPPTIAELSSPEANSYRSSSPYSDTTAYDGSHRFTSSPPPKNLMDSLDTKSPSQPAVEQQKQYHLVS